MTPTYPRDAGRGPAPGARPGIDLLTDRLEQLPALTPIMAVAPVVHCHFCLRRIYAGEVCWQAVTMDDPAPLLCRECGILWETDHGRLTYAVARTIPTHGQPYPTPPG